MESQEQVILALQAVVSDLLTRLQVLEGQSGSSGGGSGAQNFLGYSGNPQSMLPDVIPNGTNENDVLLWDGVKQWLAGPLPAPADPGEPPTGELGAIQGWKWDPATSKWVAQYFYMETLAAAVAVAWNASTKKLTYSTRSLRVIKTDDTSTTSADILTAASLAPVNTVAYSETTHKLTMQKTTAYVFAKDDPAAVEDIFEAEPCDEGENIEISYVDPNTGETKKVVVQQATTG